MVGLNGCKDGDCFNCDYDCGFHKLVNQVKKDSIKIKEIIEAENSKNNVPKKYRGKNHYS